MSMQALHVTGVASRGANPVRWVCSVLCLQPHPLLHNVTPIIEASHVAGPASPLHAPILHALSTHMHDADCPTLQAAMPATQSHVTCP